MGYNDNREHRKVIDCVLRRNARLFTNLGVDSTKDERQEAKRQERENLKRIRRYDTEMIDRLLRDE